ncbi:uncharacterized protein LOC117173946 [Belonocnema kinseyi]|uniref:uncharacterized protein LOC117173946 n=1 Tax=Belonocnema kinseyi TaxID=2817044 RepID=UPI00143D678F|nr:uncharacterized protein LOC117173946 [Belonocnema kinseyi]
MAPIDISTRVVVSYFKFKIQFLQVFHSEEDKVWVEGPVTLCVTGGGHPAVDQIRQLHHRDLKIIVPYLLFMPIWLSSIPSSSLATVSIMRLFPMANILFTVASLNETIKYTFHFSRILSFIEHCILSYITLTFVLKCLLQ